MTLGKAAAAEAIGTALLLAVVVGSGIMGERLASRKHGDRLAREFYRNRSRTLRVDHHFRTGFRRAL